MSTPGLEWIEQARKIALFLLPPYRPQRTAFSGASRHLGAYGVQRVPDAEALPLHPEAAAFFKAIGAEHTFVKGGLKPLSGGKSRKWAKYSSKRDDFKIVEQRPPPPGPWQKDPGLYCLVCGAAIEAGRCPKCDLPAPTEVPKLPQGEYSNASTGGQASACGSRRR